MASSDTWLDGFAWPVHRAHSEFVASNCFDEGSVFHSAPHMYGGWRDLETSVQVQSASGSPGSKAAESNAAHAIICELYEWSAGRTTRLRTTNGALMALLRSGDVAAFRSSGEEI